MFSICFNCCIKLGTNYKIFSNINSKIKLFIDQYYWKEIKFPSHKKNWKKFESNNKSIALNILYVPHNTDEIRRAYRSKCNLDYRC